MMNGWSDAKRNIFEHILISLLLFVSSLFWDHIVNFLSFINLHVVRSEAGAHPYQIGEAQIIVMALSAVHFVRKLNEWRYYSNLLPERLREMVKREI